MFAKAKRRQAGIYLVRTRKHRARWWHIFSRENGYVGRSNNWKIRRKQHLGQDRRHPVKPWSDLDPVWHVFRLPWWLSWKWVQAPLEALAIWVLMPRYNHVLNLANPRRVPLSIQAAQRAQRDGRDVRVRRFRNWVTGRFRVGDLLWKTAGALFMAAALAMALIAAAR